jgi:hypothetical protein
MAMIDWDTDCFIPAYSVLGVPATLTVAGTEVTITVIDDTRATTQVSSTFNIRSGGPGAIEMRSVAPGAFARVPELAKKGIVRDDYQGATLIFNGRTWVVRSHELRGSPNGEDLGEVRFLLKAIESTNG